MTFDYSSFKAAFRASALEKGIDPERGLTHVQYMASTLTSFQRVLENAQVRADLHHSRLRAGVRAVAERQKARGAPPEEGSGFFTYNKETRRYVFDQTLVDQAEATTWWEKLYSKDWKLGRGNSSTESQALAAIRRDIEAKREPEPRTEITLEDMGDVVRELLVEYPTQAEMKAQKPLERVLNV